MIIMGPKKNKIKEESKKKSKEPKNVWRWTDIELDAYANVLADPENSSAATLDKLALLEQHCWWCLDHFFLPWNELLLPTNFRGRKPALFFFFAMSNERNHPCFSLMQPHIIFNMKMQCNMFFPHTLLTPLQLQHLKYSVCPSVYTDDLIFARKSTHYCDLLFILPN